MISKGHCRARYVGFAFLLAGLILTGWRILIANQPDRLDTDMRRLAGPNAIDCGVAELNYDDYEFHPRKLETVNACAAASLEAKRPFFARYDMGRNRSNQKESEGIVRTPQGHNVYFLFNTNVCGGKTWTNNVLTYRCSQLYFRRLAYNVAKIACQDDWCR